MFLRTYCVQKFKSENLPKFNLKIKIKIMKKNLAIISLFTLFSINSFSQTPSYLPTDNLVGWWPFNGNANDESGNGNHGTAFNVDLSSDRFNNTNKCYHFSEVNDYILVQNNEILSLDSNFSVSLWFYSENMSMFNSFISKSSCNNPELKGYVCGLQDFNTLGENSKIHFQSYPYFYDATPTLPEESGIVDLNMWYHFVVTFDKSTNNLVYYLNGEFIESKELFFDISQTDLDLIFGNHFNTTYQSCIGSFMNGNLDDIGIWNRVLTRKEVDDLYRAEDTNVTSNINHPIDFGGKVECYPNPTTDVINIDLSGLNDYSGQKLRIMNLSGQIVYEENVNQSKVVIDVKSLLSSGIYVLNTVDRNGTITSTNKFVVQ
jgi:hypothetical protein